jgi:hypothetical protein
MFSFETNLPSAIQIRHCALMDDTLPLFELSRVFRSVYCADYREIRHFDFINLDTVVALIDLLICSPVNYFIGPNHAAVCCIWKQQHRKSYRPTRSIINTHNNRLEIVEAEKAKVDHTLIIKYHTLKYVRIIKKIKYAYDARVITKAWSYAYYKISYFIICASYSKIIIRTIGTLELCEKVTSTYHQFPADFIIVLHAKNFNCRLKTRKLTVRHSYVKAWSMHPGTY